MFSKHLRLEVFALLCLKAVALTVIYFSFVAPAEKPEPDDRTLLVHLFHSGH